MKLIKLYTVLFLFFGVAQTTDAQKKRPGMSNNPAHLFKKNLEQPINVLFNEQTYYVEKGIWYAKKGSIYRLIKAPIGAKLIALPEDTEELVIEEKTYFKYKRTLYKKVDAFYVVIKL